ncbi:N-acetyl-gamma-glutamyl-phosphate reductase [Corallococcus sp. EGB]|uniref:N-acetyl-gamma-glutamyl-phosphate reductase n=1 Tax=Corallococcus sp. EGB TaxID=1521117 RepID=UPI001CBD8D2F|nr:N-acetyl-gamma-glutamyl-phosphate reductase [Corallococcus sp. EGB]
MSVRVAVLGAAGYTGGEVLRLLLAHPAVEVVQATSGQFAGKRLDFPHPHLRGVGMLRYTPHEALEPCDVLVSCLPQGELIQRWPKVSRLAERVVDLSADFRLDAAGHARWYGKHPRPDDVPAFVYGLPEWMGDALTNARHVAIPGCMAHAGLLALLPLLHAGLARPDVLVVDAKTGSSGGGSTPDRSSHHPERANALRCYKPVGHRHTGELEGVVARVTGQQPTIHFSATAVPGVRGILATVHAFAARPVEEAEVVRAIATRYREKPFVRLLRPSASLSPFPEPGPLLGTNHCDLSVDVDGERGRIVVNAAIDNLVKGAAGTAVHALNLMLGRPETEGLGFRGLHPL